MSAYWHVVVDILEETASDELQDESVEEMGDINEPPLEEIQTLPAE